MGEEFYYEDDIYYDDDYMEDLAYRRFYYWDEPEFKEKIRSIAVGHIKGIYTLDNPSITNGKSGFEQVIFYASRLLISENTVADWINEKLIHKRVLAWLFDFKGGSNLSDLKNNFKNCDGAIYNE